MKSIVDILYGTIEIELPPGIFLYIGPPKLQTRVIFYNWKQDENYYEFEFDTTLQENEIIDICLEEVEKFKEFWNSPLSRALREK